VLVRTWLALTAALAALALALPAQTPAAESKPNIVFILADDLGYGDLGSYGQAVIQTPNLDRLATQGMRFTQFYAGAPVCAPSRNVLMTGQHVGHATIRGNAKVDLGPGDITVAALLKSAGYATGLVGKWGLGSEGTAGAPNAKGFDYFYGYVDQTMAHNYYPTYLLRNAERVPLRNVVPNPGPYGQGVATVKLDYSADLMADEAVQFLRDHRQGPFFLYFAPTLPHANNESRPDGMEVPDYGPYANETWPSPDRGFAAMVTRLDAQVGRLLAELKTLGLEDNTLVVFTSDNGPHAEGGHNAAFFKSSGPLRGQKRDLYEGGIRVPLIARWPERIRAGTTSDHAGYFGDFMATAADLSGAKLPAGLDSLSFLPALTGSASNQKTHDALYWEFYEGASAQAVRFGNWKAVRSPMLTGRIELYDLATDLAEKADVAAAHPDLVARAAALMQQAHVPSPLWQTTAPRGGAAGATVKE
jgi:arylsulfatase A-like enzyme